MLIVGAKAQKGKGSEKLTTGASPSWQEVPSSSSYAGSSNAEAVASSPSSSGSNQAQSKRAPAPHMFQEIVAEKTTPASALEDQKYWVDERSRHNSFVLFPRGLSITWNEDPRYWTWQPLKEGSGVDTQIEVVSLKNVCCNAYESRIWWSVPVNLQLKFPDGTVQQHKENLQEKIRWKRLDLKDGR
ncbi:hypothetical protein E2562_036839 [Oryza meyeriana var. granulata]|uniref:Uncharacterized protein n=1 Tax=Oryza meyeriana var. granulata TaxID=110450 RepID=A0A6G1E6M3_9ORYZ|nr:hypothetical protein E2562_036839 [Oryza meyeriana var. granulata]